MPNSKRMTTLDDQDLVAARAQIAREHAAAEEREAQNRAAANKKARVDELTPLDELEKERNKLAAAAQAAREWTDDAEAWREALTQSELWATAGRLVRTAPSGIGEHVGLYFTQLFAEQIRIVGLPHPNEPNPQSFALMLAAAERQAAPKGP